MRCRENTDLAAVFEALGHGAKVGGMTVKSPALVLRVERRCTSVSLTKVVAFEILHTVHAEILARVSDL